jgi:ribosomal-protein-alanine N-acetyltransferase
LGAQALVARAASGCACELMAKRAKNRSIEAALGKDRQLYIRHPARGDRAEWCELWDASREFIRPWFPKPKSAAEDDTTSRFENHLATCDLTDGQKHLVCRRKDDRIVGMVNLGQMFYGPFCNCYIGYFVFEPYKRMGYSSQGVRLVLRRAFGELKLHRVEANIIPRNKASVKLAKRAGFRLEGRSPRYLKIANVWEDHLRFAMTSEDWKEHGKARR